jgi:hypothetical protein
MAKKISLYSIDTPAEDFRVSRSKSGGVLLVQVSLLPNPTKPDLAGLGVAECGEVPTTEASSRWRKSLRTSTSTLDAAGVDGGDCR